MSREIEDLELVAQARQGHVDAFEILVERHTHAVYRVTLRMLGDRDDAEDATQDVFLQAWRSLGGFRADSAFTTWIYRVAINRCLTQLRRRRPTEPLPDAMLSEAPGPERVTEARSKVEELTKAMRRLTFEQRTVLVLRELEGCAYEEIAEILGISISAVKGRLHRARLEVWQAMRAWT